LLFATPTYTLNTAMGIASYDLLKEFEPVAIALPFATQGE